MICYKSQSTFKTLDSVKWAKEPKFVALMEATPLVPELVESVNYQRMIVTEGILYRIYTLHLAMYLHHRLISLFINNLYVL